MTMEAARVLLRARALIEKHGRIMGDYGNRERGFCLSGAVFEVAGMGTASEAWQTLQTVVLATHPAPCNYNDDPNTDDKAAFSALDAAISLALYESSLEDAQAAVDDGAIG